MQSYKSARFPAHTTLSSCPILISLSSTKTLSIPPISGVLPTRPHLPPPRHRSLQRCLNWKHHRPISHSPKRGLVSFRALIPDYSVATLAGPVGFGLLGSARRGREAVGWRLSFPGDLVVRIMDFRVSLNMGHSLLLGKGWRGDY